MLPDSFLRSFCFLVYNPVAKHCPRSCAVNGANTVFMARRCGKFPARGVRSRVVTKSLGLGNTDRFKLAMASATNSCSGDSRSFSILTVCLGNLCRSPAAEAILKKKLQENGLEQLVQVDSCGTGGGNPDWYVENGWSYHEGDRADPRMVKIAAERNIKVVSISRPMKPADLKNFDLIVVMDDDNEKEVRKAATYWGKEYADLAKRKVQRITKYCKRSRGITEVPDPWYHGGDSMRRVLDILEDACEGLLETVRDQVVQQERK